MSEIDGFTHILTFSRADTSHINGLPRIFSRMLSGD